MSYGLMTSSVSQWHFNQLEIIRTQKSVPNHSGTESCNINVDDDVFE